MDLNWTRLIQPSSGFALFFVFLIFTYVRSRRLHHKRRLPLPPGPKTSWLGQVDLPKTYQWRTYAEWRKIYGDLIFIRVMGNPILVLNTTEAINDLFEKRSATYSSRPVRTMVAELMGWDWLVSSMPYGEWWRRHRALLHSCFHSTMTPQYQSVQVKEIGTLLRNLYQSPKNFHHHVKRSAAAIVLYLAYGHEVADEGDDYVSLADRAMLGLAKAGIWGTYMVDYVPLLKYVPAWMPGAGWKRQAFQWRKSCRAMVDSPFDMIKRKMAEGKATPCFVTSELESSAQRGGGIEDETLIKNVAAASYAAGADTTVSAIMSFILAMTMYPEIQRKAQKELDAVVGCDRLPQFSDKPSLPFIECIVWESLRWNPVTPMGLARYISEEDEYRGYRIPKGTTILPNVWAVLHDEKNYPDPLTFNPERFSDPRTNSSTGVNDLPAAAFGFGRRICPGRFLAMDTLWIAIASILAVYDIQAAVDEHGNPIRPTGQYTSASLSRPLPFACRILPRSEGAAVLVNGTSNQSI